MDKEKEKAKTKPGKTEAKPSKTNWRKKADELFFDQMLSIREISGIIGISANSISKHLNSRPNYKTERERRKKQNSDRTGYFKEYYQKSKIASISDYANEISAQSLKQEHETAVKILSGERFFHE